MTMTGADTDELRALATEFTAGARELESVTADLARALDAAADWQGPDAVRCKDQLGELARTRITSVADALETAGALLQREAADQDTASGDTPAQQRPGLLAQLGAWGKLVWSGITAKGKWDHLERFFTTLARSSFFSRTRAAAASAEKVLGMSLFKDLNKYARIAGRVIGRDLEPLAAALGTSVKTLGKLAGPVSAVMSIPDIIDKGGYTGLRGEVTRVLAIGNVVAVTGLAIGAATVGTAAMAAAAPVLVTAAGVATVAYGVWTVGNHIDSMIDASPSADAARTRFFDGIEQRATSAWTGARSILDVSATYARGVLGPTPTPAGAPR